MLRPGVVFRVPGECGLRNAEADRGALRTPQDHAGKFIHYTDSHNQVSNNLQVCTRLPVYEDYL